MKNDGGPRNAVKNVSIFCDEFGQILIMISYTLVVVKKVLRGR